ncbi:MAG: efflux RND transporter permease subunit [Deltaproteobacteria bacterium]|jgi:HAE1 family hydrophobic/amphiphilic exporter-1|nr:efflux RND transporter permease subunit [Deltaproteobacteria bacterium]
MSISSLFIRRPVATTLVMIGVMVAGLMGYRLLPVADLPTVDFPTILVTVSYPGAGPETMAASVATPLEKQFSTIAGLDSMVSTNILGSSRITLQFSLERNIDAAALDVQTAISTAMRRLPGDLPNPPSFRKVNPADAPIFYLALSSPTMRLSDVNEYAENLVAQRLSTVSGVAQVMVFGAQKYAVRVQVDPEALAARGIGIDEVARALEEGNSNLPVGSLSGTVRQYTVQSSGKLMNAEEFKPLIVAWRGDAPVRLSEVARVIDSVENDRQANWFDGERGFVLAIQRQPGTNTVGVVDAIRKVLPELRRQVPAAVNFNILYDRSVSIRASVRDVQFTMSLTVILVVLVIFLFLRNISATIIPSLAVPLSVVGACAGMYLLGFSLNNLSLMALTLSVGFVVDDAVVMLENIVRHMETGKNPLQASLDGAGEVGFTILSMTISLVAVFIPVLFMGGIVGRLFHEFALTIALAILFSGFVSLTLTPMMCSRFLRPGRHSHTEGLYGLTERVFDAGLALYERSLKGVLAHKALSMCLSFIILGATCWLFYISPTGFLPTEDTGQILVRTEGQQGSSISNMIQLQQQLVTIVSADKDVAHFMSVVGNSGGVNYSHEGIIVLTLRDRSERPHASIVAERLRGLFAQAPGINTYTSLPPPLRIGGASTKSLYQFTMQSPDTATLYRDSTRLFQKVRTLPGLENVASDLMLSNPEVRVSINRDKSSALGITARQIETALSLSYGTREVSTILAPTNDFQVILELEPRFRENPNTIDLLHVRAPSGALIPLTTLVNRSTGVGPLVVNHQGQMPSVTISFDLTPGQSLGGAMEAVREQAEATLSDTINTSPQGTAQAFESSFAGLWLLLLMSVVVIYIVLGILYESFIHPLTILSGLPAAGFGALVTLFIFGKDLDLYAFVGIIMLIGIVKKNAIMMIDFAISAQRGQNLDPQEAILRGALIRFRPIMMTSMAAFMGTLPIALGHGAGAESRQPLGLAVVGGLLTSQLLTLYLTPVYYYYLDILGQRLLRLRGGKSPEKK